MRALFFAGPAELRLGELPDPKIVAPDDILVRVRATALNRLDLMRRDRTHGSGPVTFPYVSGMEYAGDVLAVGPAVEQFRPGDRVLGTGLRTFAEMTRIQRHDPTRSQQDSIARLPDWLSYEDGAAIPISFAMAWHMLHCTGHVRPDEDVLIIAGGSGTGSAGIQLAKAAGARVITTVGSEAKAEKARALGADELINHHELPEFAGRVRELTAGRGVDLVFEHVGAAVWETCWSSLKDGGRIVLCGVTSGHRASLHLGQLWTRRLSIHGCTNEPVVDLPAVMTLIGDRRVKAVVDSVYPLEEYPAAFERLKSDRFFGKVVLSISP